MKNTLILHEIVTARLKRAKTGGGFEPAVELDVGDLIVNAGRTFIASRIGANSPDAISHMAVGTVSTAAGLTDTTLTGEILRKALAVSSATDNNLYTAVATIGGAADSVTSIAIVEAGLFNHASSGQGTMYQRVTFSSIVLAASDIFQLSLQTRVGSNTI